MTDTLKTVESDYTIKYQCVKCGLVRDYTPEFDLKCSCGWQWVRKLAHKRSAKFI